MTYVPMAYLLIILVGGSMALSNIAPVPQPSRPITIGPLAGTEHRPFGRYPPITAPPGDPTLFADVECQPFVRPEPPRVRARLRPRPCCMPAPPQHWRSRAGVPA